MILDGKFINENNIELIDYEIKINKSQTDYDIIIVSDKYYVEVYRGYYTNFYNDTEGEDTRVNFNNFRSTPIGKKIEEGKLSICKEKEGTIDGSILINIHLSSGRCIEHYYKRFRQKTVFNPKTYNFTTKITGDIFERNEVNINTILDYLKIDDEYKTKEML